MAQQLVDLIAYQLAVEMKRAIYRLVHESSASRDLGFASQLRGASASVEANIAEGYHRSRRDFARFLLIARSSIDEVEVRLRDGVDRGHYRSADLEAIYLLIRRTTTAIMRLRRHLLDHG